MAQKHNQPRGSTENEPGAPARDATPAEVKQGEAAGPMHIAAPVENQSQSAHPHQSKPSLAHSGKVHPNMRPPQGRAAPSHGGDRGVAPGVVGPGVVGGSPRPGVSAARRAAGVSRAQLAANDDAPSIGGLIFALQQRPSRSPFLIAAIASAIWIVLGLVISRGVAGGFLPESAGLADLMGNPSALAIIAVIIILPIVLFWFLAILVWRAQELRLMSSAMTEVAVRLAEPDKMAEQSVASLGQTVRRQVAAMNDAISRALGRAGELEALVHNEVAALERSYTENEHRIRNLINELASEREALANNSERVSEALRGIGAQVTREIASASEKASHALTQASASMADTLASRGHKITSAVTAAGAAIDEKLAERGARITEQLIKHGQQTAEVLRQSTLEVTKAIQETSDRTTNAISAKSNSLVTSVMSMSERVGREIPALLERLGSEQNRLSMIIENATKNLSALEGALTEKTATLGNTLGERTKMLQTVLSEHTRAVDNTMVERIQVLETILNRRTQAFDASLSEKTRSLEASLAQRTQALENAVTKHTGGIRETLERHAKTMESNLAHQAVSIQRTVEELAQRSNKTTETLATHAQVLKDVSGGLLGQIQALTKRFEDQGASIMNAARALEVSNTKVDSIMESRQAALTKLLDSINNRAIELDRMMNSYSHMLEQSLSQAEQRARKVTEVLAKDSQEKSNAAIREIERLRQEAQLHTSKAVTELQSGFSTLSEQVSAQLSTLSHKFGETTKQVKDSAHKAAAEIEMTQTELRRHATALPEVTKQSASAMRKVLKEQIEAIGTLSEVAQRQTVAAHLAKPDPSALQPGFSSGKPFVAEDRGRNYGAPPPMPGFMSPQAPQAPAHPAPAPWDSSDQFDSLTSGLSQRLGAGNPPGWSQAQAGDEGLQPEARGDDFGAADSGERRGNWSLGDLLARASEPDDYSLMGAPFVQSKKPAAPMPQKTWPPAAHIDLGMEEMAAAIDPGKVLDIWQRFHRGDRSAINLGIYNPQGQVAFEKARRRYDSDPGFRHLTDRYIADFENLLKDATKSDPSGRTLQEHLRSDTGRIYLLLAHASGRLI